MKSQDILKSKNRKLSSRCYLDSFYINVNKLPKQTTSILIADSQFLIRLGLKQLVSDSDQMRVVGEAQNATELKKLLEHKKADVVILDYSQPGAFGLETVRMIQNTSPETNVLIISSDNDKSNIFEILEMGIYSFLTKQCDQQEILSAINATAKGEKFFCNKVLDFILEKSFPRDEEANCSPTPLSLREREIVQLVAEGKIAKEIAYQLNLSTHTIYTHRKNIMKKLALNSTSELVIYALNHGIIKSPKFNT